MISKIRCFPSLLLFLLSHILGLSNPSAAQTVQVVYDFGSPGARPYAKVIEGSDGFFYGTTVNGGGAQQGTIFKVSKDGTRFAQLKGFSCRLNLNGCKPYGPLIESSDGYLYGTTTEGSYFQGGTVFRIAKDGSGFALLWIFSCFQDGCSPSGRLLDGGDGYLYGTTGGGGGSIFKVAKYPELLPRNASPFVLLRKFSCFQSVDGCESFAGLIEASDGSLYGTTYRGGSSDQGTIFKIAKDGTAFTLLRNLHCTNDSGCYPYGELTEGSDGFLYGTTSSGGPFGGGMLFKLAKDGTGFTVLRQFECHGPDGCGAHAEIIEGSDGMLYSTNTWGGAYLQGTLFSVGKDGQNFTTLKSFDCFPDGCNPYSGLIQGTDGFLYGTTFGGGLSFLGTVFKIATDGTNFNVVTPLFCVPSSGCAPFAETIEGSDGFLYGTTFGGGTYNAGAVYKVAREGSGFTLLKSFKCSDSEGCNPSTQLLEASDGLLYGATSDDYPGLGTLFRVAKDGTGFTLLRKFQCGSTDGCIPTGRLTEGSDGFLYGTTRNGGPDYYGGTLFKMAKDGTGFTLLRIFQCSVPTDGCSPEGGVIQGSDGFLYGTTTIGGAAGGGTVFKIARDGTNFTLLKSIQCVTGDGCLPRATLLEGSDGFLYGTTGEWQFSSAGSLFKVAKDGTGYQQLKLFPCNHLGPCPPLRGVVEGKDGYLYGATRWYSDSTPTVVFKIAKNGTGYNEIHNFACDGDNGCVPEARLMSASDGFLYGTTTAGGLYGAGAIYRILLGDDAPNRIVDLRASASAQASITLNWTAPGDNTGAIKSYDVRLSTVLLDGSNWQSAAQVAGEPIPLPAGSAESFTVTGLLCGRNYYLAIKAVDSVNVSSELSNVVEAKTTSCNRLSVSSSLPAGEVGVPYNSGLLSISGGVAPYTVQMFPDTLPQGLALDALTIVGTPKEAKRATIRAVVIDAVGSASKVRLRMTIVKPVSIITTSLNTGKSNSSYSSVLRGKDGMKPYTWSIEGSTSLPGGGTLSIDPATGRITAFPTAAGSADITFRVTDALGGTVFKTLKLTVN